MGVGMNNPGGFRPEDMFQAEDSIGPEALKRRTWGANEEMWRQARGELLGFAAHLSRNNAGLTAAQLRMAVAAGDLAFKILPVLQALAAADPEKEIPDTVLLRKLLEEYGLPSTPLRPEQKT